MTTQETNSGALPTSATPVPGDGVATIVLPGEGNKMPEPIDLPPNVAAHLQLESIQSNQANTNHARQNTQMANGVLQAAMARNFDKIGTEEARAVSGINATPIAEPANTAK